MFSKYRPVTLLCWGLCTAAIFGIAGGCSSEHYKADADKEVYKIIDSKWRGGFGQKVNYKVSDVSPSPNDVQIEKVAPSSGVISLAQAVATATAQNRDYQTRKESLYLSALSLTDTRYQYARQWFGTIDSEYVNVGGGDEDVSIDALLKTEQTHLLANGVMISTGLAIDWIRFLAGDPRTTLRSVLSASLAAPLLGAGAGKVAWEELTQAERDVLYDIRSFNRYRKTFVVDIVTSYYGVLKQRDAVTNAENNYKRVLESKERLEMEAEAGRKTRVDVDEAEQDVLSAESMVVAAQERYEQSLDTFKIQLSLPTDANMELDQNELRALEEAGISEVDYTLDAAIETALLRRLDLANSADWKHDALRKVILAVDGLGTQLNLTGSTNVNSTEDTEVKNQAQSDLDVAQLTLDFAKQDLEQYEEGQYPNEKTAAENDITLREEELKRAEETLAWSEKLAGQKYISQTELLADKLAVTRSNNNLELAQNNLKLLENFTYQRNIAQLKSDVRQATMALERTERKARADVVQAEADLKAKDLDYKRQQDKYQKMEDQLGKAKIYAPTAGMVIYATTARRGGWRDRREPMDIGVEVTERQELIYLPTAESAMAEVDIHEASLEKVRLGLPTVITVDALPGKKFFGSVERIAPLPDPQYMWMNPDLKVYNSDVYLEGDEPSLRTGMSCKVEIIVKQYEDTVYIPVQAVIRIAGQPTVYTVKERTIEERKVDIGLDNNRMVRIISGLSEGEVVLLTPPLKFAAIEPGSEMADTVSPETSDALKQRINEKLEEANGTDVRRPPSMPSEGVGGSQREGGGRPMGRGQERSGREGLTSEQREKMRKRLENMSPEERQKEIEKMRRQFQNMSPEEGQRMRESSRGGSSGEGRRPRQRSREGNQ